jgi:hypothetical protein
LATADLELLSGGLLTIFFKLAERRDLRGIELEDDDGFVETLEVDWLAEELLSAII